MKKKPNILKVKLRIEAINPTVEGSIMFVECVAKLHLIENATKKQGMDEFMKNVKENNADGFSKVTILK